MTDEPNNPIQQPSETPVSGAADAGVERPEPARPDQSGADTAAESDAEVRPAPEASSEQEAAAPETTEAPAPKEPALSPVEGETTESPAEAPVAETPIPPDSAQAPAEAEAVQQAAEPEVSEPAVEPEVNEPAAEPEVSEAPAEPEVSEPAAEPEVSEAPAEPEVSEAAAQPESTRTPPEGEAEETPVQPAAPESPAEAAVTQAPIESEAPEGPGEPAAAAPLVELETTETAAEVQGAEAVVEAAPSTEPVAEVPAEEPPAAPEEPKSDDMNWYILKVQSNREDSIRDGLLRRVKIAGLEPYFGQIIVPTEQVTEFKGGKKRVTTRKLYPGYLVVQMEINDDTWFLVRETPGIGDFTGAAGHPTPMQPHEVSRILAKQEEKGEEAPKLRIAFHPGDKVKINDGTFESFEGEVERIDETNGRVTVLITIFGRPTPVELEYWQIESV